MSEHAKNLWKWNLVANKLQWWLKKIVPVATAGEIWQYLTTESFEKREQTLLTHRLVVFKAIHVLVIIRRGWPHKFQVWYLVILWNCKVWRVTWLQAHSTTAVDPSIIITSAPHRQRQSFHTIIPTCAAQIKGETKIPANFLVIHFL